MLALIYTFFDINKKLMKWLCYSIIILPLFYVVMTLIDPSFSIFQFILDAVLENTGDQNMADDTRTFLFLEVANDLTSNSAWLLGKGARSSYFSPYFVSADGDYYYRIVCEVALLHYLIRGGILFVVFHYGLIVYAIRKAFKFGNNKFVISIAILATGWLFVSCFSSAHGFNIQYISFYILLGCCLSNKWLQMTDSEISKCLSR